MTNLPSCLMTAAELECLGRLAEDRIVLELGTWCGESTIRMARVAWHVWTVDRHTGDTCTGPADTLATFMRNLEASGLRDRVTAVVGEFNSIPGIFQRGYFDMIVVDGSHDRLSVASDMATARNLLDGTGILAFHDWGRWSVKDVVQHAMGMPDELVESLAVYRMAIVK